jgi:hypothetical protein
LERQIRCFPYRERSDVPRLQQVEQKAVGRQRNLGLENMVHFGVRTTIISFPVDPENSGFAAPTLGGHISTFRGYRILFSIRNPNINRFTNHFSIHS